MIKQIFCHFAVVMKISYVIFGNVDIFIRRPENNLAQQDSEPVLTFERLTVLNTVKATIK